MDSRNQQTQNSPSRSLLHTREIIAESVPSRDSGLGSRRYLLPNILLSDHNLQPPTTASQAIHPLGLDLMIPSASAANSIHRPATLVEFLTTQPGSPKSADEITQQQGLKANRREHVKAPSMHFQSFRPISRHSNAVPTTTCPTFGSRPTAAAIPPGWIPPPDAMPTSGLTPLPSRLQSSLPESNGFYAGSRAMGPHQMGVNPWMTANSAPMPHLPPPQPAAEVPLEDDLDYLLQGINDDVLFTETELQMIDGPVGVQGAQGGAPGFCLPPQMACGLGTGNSKSGPNFFATAEDRQCYIRKRNREAQQRVRDRKRAEKQKELDEKRARVEALRAEVRALESTNLDLMTHLNCNFAMLEVRSMICRLLWAGKESRGGQDVHAGSAGALGAGIKSRVNPLGAPNTPDVDGLSTKVSTQHIKEGVSFYKQAMFEVRQLVERAFEDGLTEQSIKEAEDAFHRGLQFYLTLQSTSTDTFTAIFSALSGKKNDQEQQQQEAAELILSRATPHALMKVQECWSIYKGKKLEEQMGLQAAQNALEKLLAAVPVHEGVLPSWPCMAQQHAAVAAVAQKLQNEREKGHAAITKFLQALTEALGVFNCAIMAAKEYPSLPDLQEISSRLVALAVERGLIPGLASP